MQSPEENSTGVHRLPPAWGAGLLTELYRRKVLRNSWGYLVAGWTLVEIALVYAHQATLPSLFARIVLILFLSGFALVIIASWRYDLTTSGLLHEMEPELPAPAGAAAKLGYGVWLHLVLLLVALTLVGYFLFRVVNVESHETKPLRLIPRYSVAVIPFADLSGASDYQYFADGLSEEILNRLAQVTGLFVPARTSSWYFKDRPDDITAIAASLRVAHVLEGSVRRDGRRIRVTAQLIEAENGYHLWSQNYDRLLEDIFAVQDEIANAIVDVLRVHLLPIHPTDPVVSVPATKQATFTSTGPPTPKIGAWDYFLRGKAELASGSLPALQRAEMLASESLRIDPQLVDARELLVDAILSQVAARTRSLESAYDVLRQEFETLSGQQVTSSRVIVLRARLAWLEGDSESLEILMHPFPEIDTRDIEWQILNTEFLIRESKFDRADVLLNTALQRDPLNPSLLLLAQYLSWLTGVAYEAPLFHEGAWVPLSMADADRQFLLHVVRGDWMQARNLADDIRGVVESVGAAETGAALSSVLMEGIVDALAGDFETARTRLQHFDRLTGMDSRWLRLSACSHYAYALERLGEPGASLAQARACRADAEAQPQRESAEMVLEMIAVASLAHDLDGIRDWAVKWPGRQETFREFIGRDPRVSWYRNLVD